LHDIENSLGRDRSLPKFSSRMIDLDLVLYGGIIDETLNVPRKDILKYAFVLAPLAELNPEANSSTRRYFISKSLENISI